MGKITEVFYKEVDSKVCSIQNASKYHYLFNLLKYHEMFQRDYERYEEDQLRLRNTLVGEAIKSGELERAPKMNTTIFGISAQKKKAVLIIET